MLEIRNVHVSVDNGIFVSKKKKFYQISAFPCLMVRRWASWAKAEVVRHRLQTQFVVWYVAARERY